MKAVIKNNCADSLYRYGEIPAGFLVESVFKTDTVHGGRGEGGLREEWVSETYFKDYVGDEEGRPEKWPDLFDIRAWGIFLAEQDGQAVGGAAVACKTPGLRILEDRNDIAVLWDIRVHPDHRKRGIGKQLFRQAVQWSKDQGYRQMKIETQNVNVPACRFYAKQGCRLSEVNPSAYSGAPAVAHEVQLIWYFDF